MPNNFITDILVSGSPYDLKDKNATSVSAVTQQEYDNLPSSAKTSNTFFVITDAYSPDISSITTAVTSGSTDNEIPTAKAVYNAIPTVTNTITSGSTDAISSGAVYDALGDVETLLSQI